MTASTEERTSPEWPPRSHVLGELGFATGLVGEELHGRATITPHMHVPGTTQLRTSVLVTWADTLIGLLATRVVRPRVPVTADLDLHLYGPAPAEGVVHGVARTVRAGRSLFVGEVAFTVEQDGHEPAPIAAGSAAFMLAPDPEARMPAAHSIGQPAQRTLLSRPLAERARCERRAPGLATIPRTEDGLNASGTVNGGLLSLVAEEAVLSLEPGPALSSIVVRYLQGARVGPVAATAAVHDGHARVELRDTGNEDRLVALVQAGVFPK